MSGLHTTNPSPQFQTTRWSVVLAAQQQDSMCAGDALETLCRQYWYPLYAYVRRSGQTAHDAQDLTQEFFARLLEKRWLDTANRELGRLRTFLIVALKHFMAKEWRGKMTQRRGAGTTHVPLDAEFAESRYAADPASQRSAHEIFDRQWALTLLDLTLERIAAEFASAGRAQDFTVLKGCLMAARGAIDYPAISAQLGVTEDTARVAVHRLRKRFRAVYREEIAQTLSAGDDLEGELHHLAAALAHA